MTVDKHNVLEKKIKIKPKDLGANKVRANAGVSSFYSSVNRGVVCVREDQRSLGSTH